MNIRWSPRQRTPLACPPAATVLYSCCTFFNESRNSVEIKFPRSSTDVIHIRAHVEQGTTDGRGKVEPTPRFYSPFIFQRFTFLRSNEISSHDSGIRKIANWMCYKECLKGFRSLRRLGWLICRGVFLSIVNCGWIIILLSIYLLANVYIYFSFYQIKKWSFGW